MKHSQNLNKWVEAASLPITKCHDADSLDMHCSRYISVKN